MAIPFFGPFVSWAPPVIVALRLRSRARCCRSTIIMVAGWFVVMNVLQPRIMQGAVGIHPIVVLGSVLIGSRIAGIPGAIFGIPVAAVAVGLLLPLPASDLRRPDAWPAGRPSGSSEREGRPVRVPREPAPGQAQSTSTRRERRGRRAAPGGDGAGRTSRT